MNEFEWLRQTRALRSDRQPSRDLWPGIAAALPGRVNARVARPWLPMLATAAVVMLSVVLGVTALRAPSTLQQLTAQASTPRWKPDDPRLAGAAIEFQAADSEIRLALDQAPDAVFLQRIRARTQAQQWRLERYARRAP